MTIQPTLSVKQLKTYFYLDEGRVAKAVDDISFTVSKGETVALVGESGSGKSITALSIMQLINKPGRILNGSIKLHHTELLDLTPKQMSAIRGNKIAMIFQEPMTALYPVLTIGNQMIEMLIKHKKMSKKQAKNRTVELLDRVGIPRANEIIKEYPHQLSGGMRQRVMIAMAISCEPTFLIADEPTTALDVTIKAQILDLLEELKREFDMGLLLITHDLGVVFEYANRVMVMYGGQIVEQGPTRPLITNAKHPYTRGLLQSLPNIEDEIERLPTIKGTVPPAYDFPKGCRFSSRCQLVMDQCKVHLPNLEAYSQYYLVRCYLYGNGDGS